MELHRAVVSYSDVDDSIPTADSDLILPIITSLNPAKKKDKKIKSKHISNVAEHTNDLYEEPETFQTVALPAATFLSNPDLGPQSGEEYLFTVKEERNMLPSIINIDRGASSYAVLSMESLVQMGFSFTI